LPGWIITDWTPVEYMPAAGLMRDSPDESNRQRTLGRARLCCNLVAASVSGFNIERHERLLNKD
jgi:hypothetical protein